ncbi:MAG: gephyrin-like molybdotransferase Glp [Acidimicrobiales bacterium]|jgi:molybdenum cofactor synthesis domain-containing protein
MGQNGVEELVSLEEVQRTVLGSCLPLAPVEIGLAAALGHVLAADVRAPGDLPPFANSAMDGYAVRAADTSAAPVELSVIGVLPAGAVPTKGVEPATAVRIMTGAPIPPGADGIAIVERTEPGSSDGKVRILEEVSPGAYIRLAGSDLRRGELAVPAGTAIGPAHVSLLASVDATTVTVHPRPKVGVLSTGDELADPTTPLEPGQIRDSNRQGLLAALQRDGFTGVDLGLRRDNKAAISAAIKEGIERCDALLTSGGVSMGEFDFVKVALETLVGEVGGTVHQFKVAIKPAKPLSFAAVRAGGRSVPVFGLPGNPVSSMVSYQVVALPALRKLAGHRSPLPHRLPAVAVDDLERRPDGKLHLVRAVAAMGPDGRIVVRSAGAQGSHQLAALVAANALALVPDGNGVGIGGEIQIILTGPLE